MKDVIRYFHDGSCMNLTQLSKLMHKAYVEHHNEKMRLRRWCNSIETKIRSGRYGKRGKSS